jgi:hypothetical protein
MLPVFPLYVVPFPYHTVAVRLFEERYKDMLVHLRTNDGIFAMGRIWRGQEIGGSALPYRVGTLMRLQSVASEGKSFRAEALGLRRIRMTRFDSQSAPYLQAEYDEYPDLVGHDGRTEELLAVWEHYLQEVLGIPAASIGEWKDSSLFKLPLPELTLAISPFLRLPYPNLQFLLESRDPGQRRDSIIKAMIKSLDAARNGTPETHSEFPDFPEEFQGGEQPPSEASKD